MKRKWSRFVSGAATFLRSGSIRVEGIIIDESFGGIGMRCEAAPPFPIGTTVEADHCGTAAPAIIRSILPQEDGSFFIGLQWI